MESGLTLCLILLGGLAVCSLGFQLSIFYLLLGKRDLKFKLKANGKEVSIGDEMNQQLEELKKENKEFKKEISELKTCIQTFIESNKTKKK